MKKTALIFIILMLLVASLATAENLTKAPGVDLVLFYGTGCPHCAAEEEFLAEMETKYPTLEVHTYEIYFNKTNRDMFTKMSEALSRDVGGVPTTFIGKEVVVGYSDAIGVNLEKAIKSCIENTCPNPLDILKTNPSANESKPETTTKRLTVGAVVSGALVDSINPCAFAVLILLLTTITGAHGRKKALYSGIAFILAIFLSYLTMGLGLYSAIKISGISHTFLTVVAVIAIVVGLFNLKDWLWYGKWFIMEVPRAWRPKMHMLAKSVTSIPGAFIMGVLLSLFLLPCTSGPYIVILGLLSQTATQGYAVAMMILHNAIFVTPMLIITLAVYFGLTTTEKAEAFRARRLKQIHLIAGLIMLLLGIGLFVAMWLGYM